MIDGQGSRDPVCRVVVIDAVGRWKHEMFSRWRFGDLLLVKPREIRAHYREVKRGQRLCLAPINLGSGVSEINLPMPPGWLFFLMPFSARILAGTVRRFVNQHSWLLVLTLPQYHPIVDFLPTHGRTVAYYAYDDYADNWPGCESSVEAAEQKIGRKADLILCAAAHRLPDFTASKAAKGGRVHQLPVAIPDEWLEELENRQSEKSLSNRFPSPRFLSFGALTGRIDFRYFTAVARRFPTGSVLLAGTPPSPDGGTAAWWADAKTCLSMPNVHCLGWVPEQDRAAILHESEVFLMAHSACRFNLGSCPAKLWDYFAVGKPLVITQNCPEALRFPDLTYLGIDPSAYGDAAVIALMENSPTKKNKRRIEARKRSASAIANEMKRLVDNA